MGKGLVDKPHLQRFKTRLDEFLDSTFVKKTDKATDSAFGIVKPDGTTITINDGVISGSSQYELPTASTSLLGGVKIDGTTITIDSNGVISGASTYTLPTASTSTLGGVKIDGTTIEIEDGVISAQQYELPTASDVVLGGVKVDDETIKINNGVISASAVNLDYEYTEQLTGSLWVDDKPINRITIYIAVGVACTAGQWNEVCNSPTDLETLVRGEFTDGESTGCSQIKIDTGKLYVYPMVNCTVKYLTVDYTKVVREYMYDYTWAQASTKTWSEFSTTQWKPSVS